MNVGNLIPPAPESLVSLERVVQRSKVRVTVVRPPSIPFGWKVIPQTADAASVTLRVNLERLNIHFALDGFVMNVELRGKWKSQRLCLLHVSLTHTYVHAK